MWPINKEKCLTALILISFLNNDLISLEQWDDLQRLDLRTNILFLEECFLFFCSAEFQTTHRFIGCLVNNFNLFAFIAVFSSLFFSSFSVLFLCPHYMAEGYLNI